MCHKLQAAFSCIFNITFHFPLLVRIYPPSQDTTRLVEGIFSVLYLDNPLHYFYIHFDCNTHSEDQPTMADQAARGKKALQANEYDQAISYFTSALAISPTSPDYLIQRSTAYQRSKNYSSALYRRQQCSHQRPETCQARVHHRSSIPERMCVLQSGKVWGCGVRVWSGEEDE